MPDLQRNGWISVPWAEYVSRAGTTQSGRFGHEGGTSVSFTLDVNWADHVQAIQDLVGTNFYDSATGNLSRQPPVRHPLYSSMYAMSLSGFQPRRFVAKSPSRDGLSQTSYYRLARLTAAFGMPKWHYTAGDATLDAAFPPYLAGTPVQTLRRQEWRRFVSILPTATTQVIVHKPGELKWTGGTGGVHPTVGEFTLIQIPQPVQETALNLVWWRVPATPGLFGSASGQPDNLIANQNKVNRNPFLGYPKGTLLYSNYTLEPCENPEILTTLGLARGQTPLMYNVRLAIKHRDPPPGDPAVRGWRLAPYTDGLWWEVGFKGDSTKGIVDYCDFEDIFKLPG